MSSTPRENKTKGGISKSRRQGGAKHVIMGYAPPVPRLSGGTKVHGSLLFFFQLQEKTEAKTE